LGSKKAKMVVSLKYYISILKDSFYTYIAKKILQKIFFFQKVLFVMKKSVFLHFLKWWV